MLIGKRIGGDWNWNHLELTFEYFAYCSISFWRSPQSLSVINGITVICSFFLFYFAQFRNCYKKKLFQFNHGKKIKPIFGARNSWEKKTHSFNDNEKPLSFVKLKYYLILHLFRLWMWHVLKHYNKTMATTFWNDFYVFKCIIY